MTKSVDTNMTKKRVKLKVKRYYASYYFWFDSVQEAARGGIAQLESGDSFPESIHLDGNEIWHQNSPSSPEMDRLYELANA